MQNRDPFLITTDDGQGPLGFYERELYPLSNFSSFEVRIREFNFKTAEHAYQAMKFNWADGTGDALRVWREVVNAPSAHEAFMIAQRNRALQRADWDGVKNHMMLVVLRAKFEQHEYVRRKLMATGTRPLVEDSPKDAYWGIGLDRAGKNTLGRLWVKVRDEHRTDGQGTRE